MSIRIITAHHTFTLSLQKLLAVVVLVIASGFGLGALVETDTYAFKHDVTGSATQLASVPGADSVTLYAPTANAGIVYVSNGGGVTSDNGFTLEPGMTVSYNLRNPRTLWVIGTDGDEVRVTGVQ
jgi:hypothetical protein